MNLKAYKLAWNKPIPFILAYASLPEMNISTHFILVKSVRFLLSYKNDKLSPSGAFK